MNTVFVATTGGHLAQLDRLSRRVPESGAAVWVTPSSAQGLSLLEGRDVEFTHAVPGRSLSGVLRCFPIAHRLWRDRGITRAISTGSGIALGFLPYLAVRGVECHYVESAARVASPSLTGKIMRWVPGVHCHTQYSGWSSRHWHYGGSQFDCYEPSGPARDRSGPVRVLVTVGTSAFPFRRMLEQLAVLLAPGGALQRAVGRPVDVIWQTGSTPVDDLPIHATANLSASEFARELACSDLVISHAGTGSAIAAFEAGRLPVLVTRLQRYGEASDDHQEQLAAELQRRGLALHRHAGSLGVADLLEGLVGTVRCVESPRPFELHSRVDEGIDHDN